MPPGRLISRGTNNFLFLDLPGWRMRGEEQFALVPVSRSIFHQRLNSRLLSRSQVSLSGIWASRKTIELTCAAAARRGRYHPAVIGVADQDGVTPHREERESCRLRLLPHHVSCPSTRNAASRRRPGDPRRRSSSSRPSNQGDARLSTGCRTNRGYRSGDEAPGWR
jgi:hypothetical protein